MGLVTQSPAEFAGLTNTPRSFLPAILAGLAVGVLALAAAIHSAHESISPQPAAAQPPASVPALPVPVVTTVATVRGLQHRSQAGFTAIQVELDRPVEIRSELLHGPERAYFDLLESRIDDGLAPSSQDVRVFPLNDPLVRRIRMAHHGEMATRIVLDLNCRCDYVFVMSKGPPYRLVIDVQTPSGTQASLK